MSTREMMSILGTTVTGVLYDRPESERLTMILAHIEALFLTFPSTGAAIHAWIGQRSQPH
jgi:hypothetical protein